MTPPVRRSAGADMRRLGGELFSAEDDKIARVVDIIDRLPRRGAADELLVPLRPRLARLRRTRPLNFGRVLFTPLEGLILPGTGWRRGGIGIPRTALRALADAVGRQLPVLAIDANRAITGRTFDDLATVGAVGGRLWPQAALALAGPLPAGWAEATGLRDADHAALAPLMGALLAGGPQLWAIEHEVGEASAQCARLEALFDAVAKVGDLAVASLLALLLLRMHHRAGVRLFLDRLTARRGDGGAQQALERAMDFVVEQLASAQPLPSALDAAHRAANRTVLLLEMLARRSRERPSRLTRINAAYAQAGAECRANFAAALVEHLVVPAGGLAGADDAMVDRLERAALGLRRFEQVARRLGGAEHYDRALRACLPQLAPRPDDPPETRIDRARLVEILLGPEVARGLPGAD